MLNGAGVSVTHQREELLHAACQPLINTLRQLEPLDFVLLFYSSDSIAIREHFSTLVERHFNDHLVSFGLTGACEFGWQKDLRVAIDLELLNAELFACFRVWLMADRSWVEINHLSFEAQGAEPQANTASLARATEAITLQ